MSRPSESAIQILHVFGRMNRGGAEMRTLDIMRSIDRSRYRLDYCVLSGKSGELDTEIESLGGTVHLCRLGLSFPFKFVWLLWKQRPNVVHSHVWYVSGIILFLAFISRVPVRVAHFRTSGTGENPNLLRRLRDSLLRNLIDRFATHIIAVSKGSMTASWYRYMEPDSRCQIIYNGIELPDPELDEVRKSVRDEFRVSSSSSLVVHVGRFSRPKNHLRLLSIFRHIASLDESAVLLLVGSGDNESKINLLRACESLGISEKVRFAGLRDDVFRLLAAADVMVFPSLWEGLPGTVLESWAAGTPVVGSDIDGIVEIAQYTSLVTTLPLADSDLVWAKATLAAMVRKIPVHLAKQQLQDSPFNIEQSLRAYQRIWNGLPKDD